MNMVFKMYQHSMERSYTTQMTFPMVNLKFIISNMFATRLYVMQKKTHLTSEVLFWLNICFFMLGFPRELDSHAILTCFF